jgi:hypothetical protein
MKIKEIAATEERIKICSWKKIKRERRKTVFTIICFLRSKNTTPSLPNYKLV